MNISTSSSEFEIQQDNPEFEKALEQFGKEGFMNVYLDSQAKMVAAGAAETGYKLEPPPEKSIVKAKASKKSKKKKKKNSNDLKVKSPGVTKVSKSTKLFQKRLSMLRAPAKTTSTGPGITSNSKVSNIIKIGAHEIIWRSPTKENPAPTIPVTAPNFVAKSLKFSVHDDIQLEPKDDKGVEDQDQLFENNNPCLTERYPEMALEISDRESFAESMAQETFFDVDQFWRDLKSWGI